MVRLDRITTRGGDAGETGLVDGSRLSKADARIEAMGAVDEANAAIGLLRLHAEGAVDACLGRLQHDLFDLGADLATPLKANEHALRIVPAQVARLEEEIAQFNQGLPPLKSFVLPGGTPAAAHAHLARTLMRRAERTTVALSGHQEINADAVRWLNRASDLLFVLGRVLNDFSARDVLWVPASNR
jgi:cob(I)alamin adenosyltransferase